MRRSAIVLVLVAAAVCQAAGCGGDEGPRRARSQPFLGVGVGEAADSRGRFARETRLMAASGVSSVRVPFYWWRAQPRRRGPFDFAFSDSVVAEAARARLTLLPVVLGTPSWAARDPGRGNSPPRGTAAYASFARTLVDRYGPRGSFWSEHRQLPKRPLRDWQLWNEPDRGKYWSDQPFERDYVRLARVARREIKAADPGANVIMAGFADRSWETLPQVYEAGAHGVFDAAAVHPYTREPAGVLRIVELDRAALRRAGEGRTPLWLTETTWSSGQTPGRRPFPFETTEADQAARLSRAYRLLIGARRRLGIERVFWENWLSSERDHSRPFNFSGLRGLRPNGSARSKPALAAFRRAALRVKGWSPR